jgi:hypothetical protein
VHFPSTAPRCPWSWLTRCRCGPYKLAFILNQCLDRFALPEENLRNQVRGSGPPQARTQRNRPLLRLPASTSETDFALVDTRMKGASGLDITSPEELIALPVRLASTEKLVMIVDDNKINRNVCSAFSGALLFCLRCVAIGRIPQKAQVCLSGSRERPSGTASVPAKSI